MGSLMAGWDSKVQDPRAVKFMRNKSLTKEEIDSYWRVKKKTEEEHLKAISPPLTPKEYHHRHISSLLHDDEAYELTRSSSLPPSPSDTTTEALEEEELKKKLRNSCWWTRCNSAFLNEPSVLMNEAEERKSSAKLKYMPQNNVMNTEVGEDYDCYKHKNQNIKSS